MPSQTVTVYDEYERPTEIIFRVDGVQRWRTTHTYTHNRHDTDPVDGDTPTTEIYDAEGRLVELRQYQALGRRTATHEGSPSGTKRIGWTYDAPVNGKPALGYQSSATRYVDGNQYTTSLADMDASGRPTATRFTVPDSEKGLAGTLAVPAGRAGDTAASTSVILVVSWR